MLGNCIGFGGGGGSSGALAPGNDVVWLSGAGAPTNGVAGTGVGEAGPGSFYTDVTNKILYINHGTINDVLWNAVIAP